MVASAGTQTIAAPRRRPVVRPHGDPGRVRFSSTVDRGLRCVRGRADHRIPLPEPDQLQHCESPFVRRPRQFRRGFVQRPAVLAIAGQDVHLRGHRSPVQRHWRAARRAAAKPGASRYQDLPHPLLSPPPDSGRRVGLRLDLADGPAVRPRQRSCSIRSPDPGTGLVLSRNGRCRPSS